MNFAHKSAVVLAALTVAGVAGAAVRDANVGQPILVTDTSGRTAELTLTGGGGILAFSSTYERDKNADSLGGLIGALNVGNIVISALGGATYNEGRAPDSAGDSQRVSAGATAPVVSLRADDQTGAISVVQSTGGARQVGTRISGTLNGGFADVTNLRFDLANKTVFADLTGRSDALGTKPAVDYKMLGTALWTIGDITGPTVIPPSALTAQDPVQAMRNAGFVYNGMDANGKYKFSSTNVISGLKVTTTGFDFFKNSLGLGKTGESALAAVNTDPDGWGSVTSTINFTVSTTGAVPEAQTYAMMLLGLVGIGFMARKRQA